MLEGNFWAIRNVRLAVMAPLVIATASVTFAPRAEAAGTVAGSTISNTATASYTDSGGGFADRNIEQRQHPCGRTARRRGDIRRPR